MDRETDRQTDRPHELHVYVGLAQACPNEKSGQVTKPIIFVKICCKLLYVIQGVKNSFGKVTSWPQLISEFLVTHACL